MGPNLTTGLEERGSLEQEERGKKGWETDLLDGAPLDSGAARLFPKV